jgi:hypothetical protein
MHQKNIAFVNGTDAFVTNRIDYAIHNYGGDQKGGSLAKSIQNNVEIAIRNKSR